MKDEESEVNSVSPEKPKLSKIAGEIELLKYWSHFDNSGGEIRKSLGVISKSFNKLSLETKK